MNRRWLATVGSVAGVGFTVAAGCGIIGCNPSLPLSDKNGIEQTFAASESEVTLAIANAFGDSKYRKMILEPAVERAHWIRGWQPTNGFVLFSFHEPIADVPIVSIVGKKLAPYISYFHVVVTPLNSNETKVTVLTILSEVIDGKEIGVHSGWANHYRKVFPVRREEENVFVAISKQLPLPKHLN